MSLIVDCHPWRGIGFTPATSNGDSTESMPLLRGGFFSASWCRGALWDRMAGYQESLRAAKTALLNERLARSQAEAALKTFAEAAGEGMALLRNPSDDTPPDRMRKAGGK